MVKALLQFPQSVADRIPAWAKDRWAEASTHRILNAALSTLVLSYLMLQLSPRWLPANPQDPRDYLPAMGIAVLVVLVVNLVSLYLRVFEAAINASTRRLYLLSLVSIGTMGLAWVADLAHGQPYLTAVPAMAILLKIFLNARVALFMVFVSASLIGLAIAPDLSSPTLAAGTVLINTASGLVALFAVKQARQRADLARAGLLASMATLILTGAISAMQGGNPFEWGPRVMWAALSGVGSAVLAIGLLPYLEALFSITTTFKLLELANPSQPLLRYLLMKAPGTYHHSILVGNLGEAAAEAIGADPLLVRVGAYYHDIGKTKRPYFFIENQMGMENAHDKIAPRLSALVICAHVKDGLELAKEHKLPNDIQDFIAMHHGCSLVSFFYHKACQTEGDHVLEEHFRYPGPRPNSKETAIVMLADAIEAVVRTLKQPTVEQIDATIRKIISKRLNDGELSEAPLTLAEIETISQTFSRIIQGLYHQRIEYPDQLLEKLKQADQKGKKVGSTAR